MLTPAVGRAQDSPIQILTPQGSRHQQPLLPLRPNKPIIIISTVCLGVRKGLILESVSLKLTFEACQAIHVEPWETYFTSKSSNTSPVKQR